jgi:hypothetical protein
VVVVVAAVAAVVRRELESRLQAARQEPWM